MKKINAWKCEICGMLLQLDGIGDKEQHIDKQNYVCSWEEYFKIQAEIHESECAIKKLIKLFPQSTLSTLSLKSIFYKKETLKELIKIYDCINSLKKYKDEQTFIKIIDELCSFNIKDFSKFMKYWNDLKIDNAIKILAKIVYQEDIEDDDGYNDFLK